jgi:hypothetical protein
MQILIYDPGDLQRETAKELRKLIDQSGCSSDWFNGFVSDANDYREWMLLHERVSQSRFWQRLARRNYDVFIGIDSASAVLAAVLPPSWPRIGVVSRLESFEMQSSPSRSRSAIDFHLHIEIDLLRTFGELIAAPAIAALLGQHGLHPQGFNRLAERLIQRAAA